MILRSSSIKATCSRYYWLHDPGNPRQRNIKASICVTFLSYKLLFTTERMIFLQNPKPQSGSYLYAVNHIFASNSKEQGLQFILMATNGNNSLMMKKAWHKYWTTIEARYRKRKWILRSQKYRFKQANRNALLLLIGHGKRTSLKTNLVSENELAIFHSKGRQFRLSAKTAPFLGMQTKMTVKPPHGDLGQHQSGMAQSRSQSLRSAPRAYFASHL